MITPLFSLRWYHCAPICSDPQLHQLKERPFQRLSVGVTWQGGVLPLTSPSEYDAYFRPAQALADCFAACEDVVGVLLTDGVARGYADRFSELDLAVYLTRPHFEDWTRS